MQVSPESAWAGAVAIGALGICFLLAQHRRHRRALAARRGAMFVPAYGILQSYEVSQSGIDYPVLRCTYRGYAFQVDSIADTMTFRKLPVLWLRVSLVAPLPGSATLDILVRSQNVEFYSPSDTLPHRMEARAGWPADAMVRTDNAGKIPSLDVLDRHIGVFGDPKIKELLITARGIRVVYMLDQARRAEYLVLRQAEFDNLRVEAELLRELMERQIAIYEELRP